MKDLCPGLAHPWVSAKGKQQQTKKKPLQFTTSVEITHVHKFRENNYHENFPTFLRIFLNVNIFSFLNEKS